MLSGKALARAVRGHFLVDSALNALLVNVTFDSPLPATIGLDTETGVNLADKEGELNASDVQAADQDLKKVGTKNSSRTLRRQSRLDPLKFFKRLQKS